VHHTVTWLTSDITVQKDTPVGLFWTGRCIFHHMLCWSRRHLVGQVQLQAASRVCQYQKNELGILSYWKQFHTQSHQQSAPKHHCANIAQAWLLPGFWRATNFINGHGVTRPAQSKRVVQQFLAANVSDERIPVHCRLMGDANLYVPH